MSYNSGPIFKYVETLYKYMTDTSAVSDRIEKIDVGALLDSMSPEERKGIQGWYWYDWANQAYALTVMTVIAPQVLSLIHI